MSAQDVLGGIIAREAGKLDKLSALTPQEPLPPAAMEALEVLCRCTKQLKFEGGAPEDPAESMTTEDALAAVNG